MGALRRFACAILFGASATGLQAQTIAAAGPEIIYRMQVGDTPWGIAEQYLSSMSYWRRIVRLNSFADSTRLPAGTPVRIPQAWLQRQPVPLTVLATFDEVFLLAIDGQRRAATPGAVLAPGERLVTSDIGSATLGIENGSRILVRPGTELALTDASRPIDVPGAELADPEPSGLASVGVQLRLLRGAIEGAVRRLKPSGRFEIETPAAVAAVRGTNLRVATDGAVATTEVTTGNVVVLNTDGRVGLEPEQGTRTVRGSPPEPPTQLLPAPDLSALPQVIERLPIDLPVPSIDGAIGYRAQFYPDPYLALLSDRLSKGPRARAADLRNGQYQLKVRAVDARGLEGLSAELFVRVHTHPAPPLLIEPAPEARLGADRPKFRWSEAAQQAAGGPVREVRLQVAPTADFTAPVVDVTATDAGAAHPEPTLAPGTWFWRLAAIDAEIGPGPWSDPQEFRRILAAPGVEAPEVDSTHLSLRWPRVPGATGYRVQIGTASDFASPVVDERVDADRFVLDRPEAGVYYMRVQALGADGEPGDFSPPEKFTVEKPVSPWYFLWLLAPLLLAF